MTHVSAPEALDVWQMSATLATELSARLPFVYRPDHGEGCWLPTLDALLDVLGWPPEWETRVEEVQVRADAPCPRWTFLDIHGRDPRHPQDVRGTTVAVADRSTW